MKILIAEPVSSAGLDLFKAHPSWEVVVSNPKEYLEHLSTADALLVRSAVKVNKDVLAKAPKLRVIGRAGVGVDNVDLKEATAAGVLVMNTPGGNAISVAEHTVGLMLGMARSLPQASVSTKSGKWEKKKFLGSELRGKTLGVIGLGSAGREVVKRAKSFEMRIIAHDPYVSTQAAADVGVEKLVDLSALYAQSDYITLHMALTPETENLLSAAAFAQMKDGVRIVNVARGELIDGEALNAAIASGKVAGAGLDVFRKEPPAPENPLLAQENLIATPHIGGSTEEAQEIVGLRISQQVIEYLTTGIAINAVNMPALSPDQYKALGPYVDLAERLGNFAAHVSTGNPSSVRITYFGKIADSNTNLLRNGAVAGVLNRSLSRKANLVNALQLATDRGWTIQERNEKRISHADTIRIELDSDSGTTTVEGAVVLDKPRLVQVDGIYCEAPLAGHLTFLKNEDVPGVIGYLGNVMGRNGINIANFSLGRQDLTPSEDTPLEAVSVIETDQVVPDAVLVELLKNTAVRMARSVEFTN
jgi:D-3-phosphoglycerate dehydrogenase / 2-oxoglutarate reductase